MTLATGCAPGSPIREAVRPSSPYERYAESLRSAALDETALGREWLTAGMAVLRTATAVDLPLREAGYLAPTEPAARAWRFTLPQGRRLVVDVETVGGEPFDVYLDLFAMRGDPPEPALVASAEDGATRLDYQPERAGDFVLRLQPELLRGGRFTITEQSQATLTFPVNGRDSGAVASSFGDPRDAGGREHHGIDIFAPRGTPAIAAADAWVSSVGTNNLGGNVVWLRTADGVSLYYAHLDEQTVRSGSRVSAGDQVGTVGNTGNARTTAPHLHFGVYSRAGPVDPFPYVNTRTPAPPAVVADLTALGGSRRISGNGVRMRSGPAATSPILNELARHTMARIDGAVGDWYRLKLPDGSTGFVSARLTESAARPVRTARLATAPLLDRPLPTAAAVAYVSGGTSLLVHGRFGEFLFVKTPEGHEGWIADGV